ncbi:MAG: hypothetical protein AVDCRST_MAG71-2444 [uncultured Lysobacter sp.]|uniref:FimV N-terminal domain-containing protein n=1 Tax=uncultured Lysobacter sp. TaxID=271060 RepID=A0A6J4M3C3_9GAMM|nr:MAG: hypothetical protein AVDCRST_MAG71-2444 [uncultured Lysobacter sp.]
MKHSMRHPSLRLALSAALALASSTAAALGLGQIEVRSGAGQPLLAEIPVISNDPAELEFLQARLASPETFARIGLRSPVGAAADLEFTVGTNRAGRPVIRVTTQEPVNEPLLTFLVEVDWGQGRLVREYSALVDAPRAVAAPVQPPIQAPLPAPSNVIERPAQAAGSPAGDAAEQPQAGANADAGSQAPAGGPSEYGPVRRGDSLSKIAARVGLVEGNTLDQAMVALLRANPDAFIGGDINQLKQGAVLRVPATSDVAAVDASQAAEVVRERMRQWRQARRAVAASAVQETAAPAAAAPAAAPTPGPRRAPAPTASSTKPSQRADARLEIAPPAASRANRAGTQSGIEAGGEGQMLRQELQESREALAARDAELQELKGRIAELEKLQADQQRLVALKDSELAAAQQRLATTGQPANPAAAAPDPGPARDSGLPWLLGGVALLALLLGGWWTRRRSAAQPVFRAPATASTSDLAAAFPLRDPSGPDEDLLVVKAGEADETGALAPIASSHAAQVAPTAAAPPHVAADAPAASTRQPTKSVLETPPSPSPAVASLIAEPPARLVMPDSVASEPTPAAPIDARPIDEEPQPAAAIPPTLRPVAPTADTPAPVSAPVNERIELAQAYLELGDHESARQLLGEVAVTGDHASRQQAIRLLRGLDPQ